MTTNSLRAFVVVSMKRLLAVFLMIGAASLVARAPAQGRRAPFERPRLIGPDPAAKPFEYVTVEGIPFYEPGGKAYHAGGTWNRMPKPLSPAESMRHMILPEGFEAKLFAAEPDIVKPLTMAWDERGRLWVVESLDYPNTVTEPGQGHDRIKICEDTDGDGRADRFSVFADGLNIPTSITFARGGIIIPEGGSTWFLKDTDGDGRADLRRELFSGWNAAQRDTHAGPSNFRYGLDNWIWGAVGYSAFEGSVGGKALRFQQGLYRFKPDGSALEFLRSTSNNTWGLGFSEEGAVFGSTANGCPSVYLPIPNRYYESVRGGWSPGVLQMISPDYLFQSPNPKVRQVDWHGGYTAAAGHALYTARAYPKAYWNRAAFVADPTGHLVGTFVIDPRGADFSSRNEFNLLASMDEWTSPIMAEVGPDGAVWVIDWYAYIVQHNPTPQGYVNGPGNAYVTPRRDDHRHGRIYRIVYTGRETRPSKALDLLQASPAELLAALRNDNLLWRMHAQRLLVERQDRSVVPALIELITDPSVDEIGLNVGAIHALWTLKGLGALDDSNGHDSNGHDSNGHDSNGHARGAAIAALTHPSAGVRRNAVQVLPAGERTLSAILDAGVLVDPDAQVRLMALLAMADQPAEGAASSRAGAAIFAAVKRPANLTDRWIPDAAIAAAAKHDAGFLRAALADVTEKAADTPRATARVANPTTSSADAAQAAPRNLITNGSFEELAGDVPAGWRPLTHAGEGAFTVDSISVDGQRSAKITSGQGGDVSWSQDVRLKPHTRYRLSAWVKTRGLQPGQSLGALFNVHQLQRAGIPPALTGDTDWTRLSSEFTTAQQSSVTINMLLGGWGRAKGEAWFDDVRLIELGAAEGGASEAPEARLARSIYLVARHHAAAAPGAEVLEILEALPSAPPRWAESVLDGVVAGWPDGADAIPRFSAAERERLAALGREVAPDHRDRLLVLANRWGQSELFTARVTEVVERLAAELASADASPADRADAARRMLRLRDDVETIERILAHVTPQAPGELSSLLIQSLADSRRGAVAEQLIDRWETLSPAARTSAVGVMRRRTAWTRILLNGVREKTVARADLTASDWQALRSHRDAEIAQLARSLDTVTIDPNRMKVLDALRPALGQQGDLAVGKRLFGQLCVQCHAFNGSGGRIGPELTGIGTRDPVELLAEIVDPNRSVEANYRIWEIETRSRDHYSGRLSTETQTTVELMDVTGQTHVIPRPQIRSMRAGTLSIMPAGLIDALKHEEVASLLAYLRTGHPPQPN